MDNLNDNNGSFLNGFAVGLLAGAMGYFLFGTDRGSDIRENLNIEWEKAKTELEKEGVITEGKSLRELIVAKINEISSLSKAQPASGKQPAKPRSKALNSKAKSSAKKFKGV
jgi:gas vesicle protein